MIAAEPPAAIEGLKRLTAHALSGDLAGGLAMERDILGELYRSEIGQQARARIRREKRGAGQEGQADEQDEAATIIAGSAGRMAR